LEMDFVDTQLSIIPAKGVGCAACPQNEGILLANSEAPNFASPMPLLQAQKLGATPAKLSALSVVK
jgi:hypothetical protein